MNAPLLLSVVLAAAPTVARAEDCPGGVCRVGSAQPITLTRRTAMDQLRGWLRPGGTPPSGGTVPSAGSGSGVPVEHAAEGEGGEEREAFHATPSSPCRSCPLAMAGSGATYAASSKAMPSPCKKASASKAKKSGCKGGGCARGIMSQVRGFFRRCFGC